MALREGLPGTIYRKDYQAPAFGIETVDLLVQIEEGRTLVTATLDVTRQQSGTAPLKLDGEQLVG
jgi:aminopeptidase N